MYKYLLFLIGIGIYLPGHSQVLEGTVREKGTNESLPGANIYWSGTTTGTTSDAKGKFVSPGFIDTHTHADNWIKDKI